MKMMECIKTTLLSSMNGYAPQIAVEFGRKTLFLADRPSFIELEEHVRQVRTPMQANPDAMKEGVIMKSNSQIIRAKKARKNSTTPNMVRGR